jgi:hypothetical protein
MPEYLSKFPPRIVNVPLSGSTMDTPPAAPPSKLRPVRSTVPETLATTSLPTCSIETIVAALEQEQSRNNAPKAHENDLLFTAFTMRRLVKMVCLTFAE